jgi:C1A family cysteine protease
MPRTNQRYGWIPDLPDQRDLLFAAPRDVVQTLPPKVDLTDQCPPVYDQGELGSCTANAIAAAVEFDQMKQRLAQVFTPSRLFIYYNERVIEDTVASDSGAMIRDGIKSVAAQGACPETLWPYVAKKFKNKPAQRAYTDAVQHKVSSYQRVVRDVAQMKGCLAAGFPFVFGFTAYESFESEDVARTGQLPMPAPGEQVVGGHAVLAVGYDDAQSRFIVRNSWGPDWGMKGYFTMPYGYMTGRGLASDFWTIRLTG